MPVAHAVEELNTRFAIPDALRFDAGPGGLPSAVMENPACKGRVYLHGAHVSDYQPTDHDPVLFMSPQSAFAQDKAIRGGVPICFPWFGPHATDKTVPTHGPARISAWRIEQTRQEHIDTVIELAAAFDPFDVRYAVRFGGSLSMSLHIRNTSDASMSFEAALHTYLVVADVSGIEIAGLENTDYLDKVDGQRRKTQAAEPIRLTGETDRVYVDTQATCVLTDPRLGRRITVDKSGSDSTVIWNPWIDKARALSDLGDDDWRRMVCIETANAGPNAVTLDPGATHEMSATLSVARL